MIEELLKCFDESPDIKGKISELDWPIIEALFQKYADKKITMHNAESIGLITHHGTKEVPSFGGIILFGTNRLKIFPEAIIRCARFLGEDRDKILDQANIEIYPPLAIEEAIKFIQRNTSMRSEVKKIRRKDFPQYPPVALREAIVNAIVHTDYSIKGVYTSIAIFDSRIEITNPGALPFGFTLEKALAGSSRIRNRVIAKTFYHLKWIEQWGRGLQLIVKECNKFGLGDPKFEELNNQFRVTLFATKKSKPIDYPWQKLLINEFKKKPKISTGQAAKIWKVTTRTARLRLIQLINAGIIKKVGTSTRDPYSGYVLIDKKNKF